MLVVNELFCDRIEAIKTVIRADPEHPCAVFKDGQDDIIAQAIRIIRICT